LQLLPADVAAATVELARKKLNGDFNEDKKAPWTSIDVEAAKKSALAKILKCCN